LSSSYALGLALGSLMAGLTFDRLHPETAINVTGVIKLVVRPSPEPSPGPWL
jgi:hypothetical protein